MKKWKLIVPLAGAAIGSLAAGVSVLLKKLPKTESPVSQAAPAKTANLKPAATALSPVSRMQPQWS